MFPELRQPAKRLGLFIVYVICAVMLIKFGESPQGSAHVHEKARQAAGIEYERPGTAEPASGAAFDEKQAYARIVKMDVTATGYTAGPESTGKQIGHPGYGITYSGVKVRRAGVSTIAADPEVFPIGTLLYIPDYGYGIVADTGSAIKGNKIDLFFETKEDVYSLWGKKDVRVLVIYEGDGKLSEQTMNELNDRFSQNGHLLDLLNPLDHAA